MHTQLSIKRTDNGNIRRQDAKNEKTDYIKQEAVTRSYQYYWDQQKYWFTDYQSS